MDFDFGIHGVGIDLSRVEIGRIGGTVTGIPLSVSPHWFKISMAQIPSISYVEDY